MCKGPEKSPDTLSSNFHELHPILKAPPQANSPYPHHLPSTFPMDFFIRFSQVKADLNFPLEGLL